MPPFGRGGYPGGADRGGRRDFAPQGPPRGGGEFAHVMTKIEVNTRRLKLT